MTRIAGRQSVSDKLYGNHERRIRGLEFRNQSSTANIVLFWDGNSTPNSTGPVLTWIIPQLGGSNVTFDWNLMTAYFVHPPSTGGSIIVKTEMSTDGGVTWSTIGSLTITPTTHLVSTTISGPSTMSTQLVRLNWTQIYFGASIWMVELEGSQS